MTGTMPGSPSKAARRLRWALLAGAFYFALVALAHTLGIKWPVLFIYFDVPSHAYQDQIIGFLCLGWGLFFHAAARDPQGNRALVASLLAAGLAAALGIAAINVRTDFVSLTGGAGAFAYWLGAAGALAYWVIVLTLYRQLPKEQPA